MDNSNGYTSSILQSSQGSSGLSDLASTNSISGSNISSSSSNSIMDMLKNISLTTWLIIFLILAFLGFNIFVYLAKGTETITSIFGPLIKTIVGLFTVITGDVVDVAAEGTKTVVNATAGTIDKGLTAIENVTPNTQNSNFKAPPVKAQQQQPDLMANNTLNKALNTSQNTQSSNIDYEADESTSNIQSGSSKSGWCYIGEDRGFRSCAQVGENDMCMSGDIFPTQEICVNPSLRS
jgi:hypothetical protein